MPIFEFILSYLQNNFDALWNHSGKLTRTILKNIEV